jgi:hypothetical protein
MWHLTSGLEHLVGGRHRTVLLVDTSTASSGRLITSPGKIASSNRATVLSR